MPQSKQKFSSPPSTFNWLILTGEVQFLVVGGRIFSWFSHPLGLAQKQKPGKKAEFQHNDLGFSRPVFV
jgi:hypothetical protein